MRLTNLCLFAVLLVPGCQQQESEPASSAEPDLPSSPEVPADNLTANPSRELQVIIASKELNPDSIKFEGRTLTFRKGEDFWAEMQIDLVLPKTQEMLTGQDWLFSGDNSSNPKLQVQVRSEGSKIPTTHRIRPENYTLSLKISKHTWKVIEGTIDLKVTSPVSVFVVGKFSGSVKKTGKDPLDPDDAPYIQGKVVLAKMLETRTEFAAGFVARGKDGKNYSNLAGLTIEVEGGGWSTQDKFDPQLTSMAYDENGIVFKHTQLEPGEYWIYVKRKGVVAAWKSLVVEGDDQIQADLSIDPTDTGSLIVTLTMEVTEERLQLIPEGLELPGGSWFHVFDVAELKKGKTMVQVADVPAGRYKVVCGKSEANVEVVAGKLTEVTLVHNK